MYHCLQVGVEKMEPDSSWKFIRARDTFFTIMRIKHGNGPREVVDQFLGSVY